MKIEKKEFFAKQLVAGLFLMMGFAVCAGSLLEEQKLLASDGAQGDQFGFSAFIQGNRAFVGTPLEHSATGAVYVFEFNGSAWSETQKIVASDGNFGDLFGASIDVDGSRMVIGAFLTGNSQGAVYVFEFDGSEWLESAKLLGSNTGSSAEFGAAVSLEGDVVAVGAVNNANNATGSVYLYELNGVNWLEVDELQASDLSAANYFGSDVDLLGNRLLVGTRRDPVNGTFSGAAFIFEYDGNQWAEVQKLIPGDGFAFQRFGGDVALGTDKLIIGAHGDNSTGTLSGAAYTYGLDGNNLWVEEQKLVSDDAVMNDRFGENIAMHDNWLVIGSFNTNQTGGGYLYHYTGSQWNFIKKITASDAMTGDNFSSALHMDGDKILIGADKVMDNGFNSGAAYVVVNDLIFVNGFEE